jgi:hypothetical protein
MRAALAALLVWASLQPVYASSTISWWGESGGISLNGQQFEISHWLAVVRNGGNDVCAVQFDAFAGDETAHLYRGATSGGMVKLKHVSRIRGGMFGSPQMDLYSGASLLFQRINVYGDNEQRLLALEPLGGPPLRRHLAEVTVVCAGQ